MSATKGDTVSVYGTVKLGDYDKFRDYGGGTGREVEVEVDGQDNFYVKIMDWKQQFKHGDRVKVSGTVRYVKDWDRHFGGSGQSVWLDKQRVVAAKPKSAARPAPKTAPKPQAEEPTPPASTASAPATNGALFDLLISGGE